jgi:hypothetical protein
MLVVRVLVNDAFIEQVSEPALAEASFVAVYQVGTQSVDRYLQYEPDFGRCAGIGECLAREQKEKQQRLTTPVA